MDGAGLIIIDILIFVTVIIPLLYHTVRSGIRIQKDEGKPDKHKIRSMETYALIVMPIIGYLSLLFFREEEEMLDWKYMGSVIFINLITIGIYFLSRLRKRRLGPILLALIPTALISGIFLFAVMLYHFASVAALGFLMLYFIPLSFFVFAYIALLQAIILFLFELIAILKFNRTYFLNRKHNYPPFVSHLYRLYLGKYGIIAQILTFPFFLFVAQFLFIIFTARADSLYRAFTESQGGLLSSGECEYCKPISGGTDYVCTIAAHGHPRLVKPVFMGQRHGRFIPVNRQLQVCNAFEELLAEQFPRLQKVLRKVYDRLQIPVDRWKHSGLISNLLYVLIKPLEWSFLFYLYAFDPSPEKRIGRQYRSKAIHGVE